jgi:hypothetical protein
MEREIIVERTRAGLIAAAARGRHGGRPAALDASKIRAAKAMLASGSMSAIGVAQQLGCAPSTLYRHLPGGRTAVAASGMPPTPDATALPQARSGLTLPGIGAHRSPHIPRPGVFHLLHTNKSDAEAVSSARHALAGCTHSMCNVSMEWMRRSAPATCRGYGKRGDHGSEIVDTTSRRPVGINPAGRPDLWCRRVRDRHTVAAHRAGRGWRADRIPDRTTGGTAAGIVQPMGGPR